MNRRESLKLIGASAALAATGRLIMPTAAFAQAPADAPFKLPPLGYPYEALEPHIDAQTMMVHHDKHHAAYVAKCNEFAKEVPALATTPIEKTLGDPAFVPVQLQQQVKNNLGGHWNHSFFWELMKPGGAKEPGSALKSAIEGSWKDVNDFKERFNAAGEGRFGSGWAWLVVKDGKLTVINTPYQDSPHMDPNGAMPVIGIDVWEHAYYLKHQYQRGNYVDAWWNVVNWNKAAESFRKAAA